MSVYLLVTTLVCFISIEFIVVNADISKKQELLRYVRDYTELYGESVRQELAGEEEGIYVLTDSVNSEIVKMADKYDVAVHITYVDSTADYRYYRMTAEYDVSMGILGIKKKQKGNCLLRTEIGREVQA